MKKIILVILGILFIFSGVYLFFRLVASFEVFGYVFAIVMLFSGIVNLYVWNLKKKLGENATLQLVFGIISIIFAIMIFCDAMFKFAVELAILNLAASCLVVVGFVRVFQAFSIRKLKNSNWFLILLMGILLIMSGIICFCNPLIQVLVIGINLSINLIVSGLDIITLSTLIN